MPRLLSDTEERVLEYMMSIKKPVTTKSVAKRFIMSESRASTILKFLHEKGYTDITVQGSTKLHRSKH